jgi:NAD(P)-dependent dehydrogenase (short-subunit alcohol dehydrogenase family)
MNLGLTDKIAMVAGGSQGIGIAVAQQLAAEGAHVSICGRSPDALTEAVRAIEAATGVKVLAVQADFARVADITRFAAETADYYGGLDILVNSVGSSMFGSFGQVPDEVWVGDVTLKLFGAVRAARAVLPYLCQRGGGRIINIAGNSGKQPYMWHYPGGASNAALINFTHALAQEVAKDNILVTAVCPGPVETRRLRKQLNTLAGLAGQTTEEHDPVFYAGLPLGRAATAEEVANLVVFLASERSSYITGTAITIDGGITKGI